MLLLEKGQAPMAAPTTHAKVAAVKDTKVLLQSTTTMLTGSWCSSELLCGNRRLMLLSRWG